MRTTIELPEDMYTRTQEIARQKGISMQEVIVNVLKRELSPDETSSKERREVEFPLIRSKHPGTMDLTRFDFDDLLA